MRIFVAAHDAGGSEVLAAWVRHHSAHTYIFCLGGPAEKIFFKRLGQIQYKPLSEALSLLESEKFDQILTGSSWGTDIERKIHRRAHELELYCIAYIDGYGDFRNGFFLEGKFFFPDEVWVTSTQGEKSALSMGVPKEKLKIVPSLYLEDMKKRVQDLERMILTESLVCRILYICENISSAENSYQITENIHRGYNEYEALDFFLSKVKEGDFGCNLQIRIRPHPSENSEKYLPIIQKYSQENIQFSQSNSSLEADLAWSQIVVGCESVALLLAAECRREVYSYIPPHAKIVCRLPTECITKMGYRSFIQVK